MQRILYDNSELAATYNGVRIGDTTTHAGQQYVCKALIRGEHTCRRGLACKGAWSVLWTPLTPSPRFASTGIIASTD